MNDNEIVFIAENRKPDHMQTDTFERVRWDGTGANVSQPWFDITKDVIVATAIECGLTDIMIHSHSCTETPMIRCGVCWWCNERAWAFNENNYTDPGRY
jgi:7-cyano-7-deazaguanine synthase in queuosine biosynthesis